MNNRKYHIIVGSMNHFNDYISQQEFGIHPDTFLNLVQESDASKTNGTSFKNFANTLIVSNKSYHGISEQAHDRLETLIEELTTEDAEIFLHNPPSKLYNYLLDLKVSGKISIEECKQKYNFERNEEDFTKNIEEISTNILGQNQAIVEMSKSMWYLTKVKREKPYVVMLYGSSGVGKTQLVREIASKFYDNVFFEKHLSMYKNDSYSDYFFGEKPNKISMAYDLAQRNSNLIFFDELDKCPEYFYSAFYSLFDNAVFMDKTYEVETSGSLIILTSNFSTVEEMQNKLGLPIYYRIDKFIKFDDFSHQAIFNLVIKEIDDRRDEYKEYLTSGMIYSKVSRLINLENENARTIKYKVQSIIEELLFSQRDK